MPGFPVSARKIIILELREYLIFWPAIRCAWLSSKWRQYSPRHREKRISLATSKPDASSRFSMRLQRSECTQRFEKGRRSSRLVPFRQSALLSVFTGRFCLAFYKFDRKEGVALPVLSKKHLPMMGCVTRRSLECLLPQAWHRQAFHRKDPSHNHFQISGKVSRVCYYKDARLQRTFWKQKFRLCPPAHKGRLPRMTDRTAVTVKRPGRRCRLYLS